MYKIGEFSKLVDLSIKTLRYYDEEGILKPKLIDKFTGYRYYDDDSILDVELIKMLKSFGFTIEEIKKNKDNITKDILESKSSEILNEISFLKNRYNKLQEIINLSKEEKIAPKVLIKKDMEEQR